MRLILAKVTKDDTNGFLEAAFGFEDSGERGYIVLDIDQTKARFLTPVIIMREMRSVIAEANEYHAGFGDLIRQFLLGLPGDSWAIDTAVPGM